MSFLFALSSFPWKSLMLQNMDLLSIILPSCLDTGELLPSTGKYGDFTFYNLTVQVKPPLSIDTLYN